MSENLFRGVDFCRARPGYRSTCGGSGHLPEAGTFHPRSRLWRQAIACASVLSASECRAQDC